MNHARREKAVTPAKHSMRKVKFTPEEMAYDLPDDTAHFVAVKGRREDVFAKPVKSEMTAHRQKRIREKNAKLEPEVREAFPDDKVVNDLLKQFIRLARNTAAAKRKKSA